MTEQYKFKQQIGIKKIINSLLIVVLLLGGLYGFVFYESLIYNTKFSYVTEIYAPIYMYKIEKVIDSGSLNPVSNFSLLLSNLSYFNKSEEPPVEEFIKADSVPVLLYHGIVEEEDGENIQLEDFRKQMFALKEAGWETVSLKEFHAFMGGEKELPEKSFVLTFDDGRKDSYYPVDPILKALDYEAVMFVITEHSFSTEESNYYLSEKELKRVVSSGRWEIGSHTDSSHKQGLINVAGEEGNYLSNLLWLDEENRLETKEEFRERIFEDLLVSKKKIEESLDVEVVSLAYPYGDFGQSSVNFPEADEVILDITEGIYPLAFYQVGSSNVNINNYPGEGFMVKRINVKSDWSSEDLLNVLEEGKI